MLPIFMKFGNANADFQMNFKTTGEGLSVTRPGYSFCPCRHGTQEFLQLLAVKGGVSSGAMSMGIGTGVYQV
jgi:hypothetical protein